MLFGGGCLIRVRRGLDAPLKGGVGGLERDGPRRFPVASRPAATPHGPGLLALHASGPPVCRRRAHREQIRGGVRLIFPPPGSSGSRAGRGRSPRGRRSRGRRGTRSPRGRDAGGGRRWRAPPGIGFGLPHERQRIDGRERDEQYAEGALHAVRQRVGGRQSPGGNVRPDGPLCERERFRHAECAGRPPCVRLLLGRPELHGPEPGNAHPPLRRTL